MKNLLTFPVPTGQFIMDALAQTAFQYACFCGARPVAVYAPVNSWHRSRPSPAGAKQDIEVVPGWPEVPVTTVGWLPRNWWALEYLHEIDYPPKPQNIGVSAGWREASAATSEERTPAAPPQDPPRD